MIHQDQPIAFDEIRELRAEHGFCGMSQAIGVLRDEVMKLERAHALGAAPYQRAEARTGHANGFKPKTLHTRRTSHSPRPASPDRHDGQYPPHPAEMPALTSRV